MEVSRISKLREKFQTELFNSSKSVDLLCENNENRTIPCPNGFCQLINDGESGLIRNCIPEGFSSLPPGILIRSSMVEDFKKKSPFMYICNQHMCNNLTVAQTVKESLSQHGLLTPFNIQQPSVSETTTPIRTSTTTTISNNNILCFLLPIMTFFLEKYQWNLSFDHFLVNNLEMFYKSWKNDL